MAEKFKRNTRKIRERVAQAIAIQEAMEDQLRSIDKQMGKNGDKPHRQTCNVRQLAEPEIETGNQEEVEENHQEKSKELSAVFECLPSNTDLQGEQQLPQPALVTRIFTFDNLPPSAMPSAQQRLSSLRERYAEAKRRQQETLTGLGLATTTTKSALNITQVGEIVEDAALHDHSCNHKTLQLPAARFQ